MNAADDNDPEVLGEIIDELKQRTEQIMDDQKIMLKKVKCWLAFSRDDVDEGLERQCCNKQCA